MKLYYFDLTGRAETARLLMKVSGKDMEDIRFSFQDWGAKYKAMAPSGQAPWLETDDGKVITQSTAINVYCAQSTGLLPKDAYQLARTIELIDSLEEIFKAAAPTFALSTTEEKIEARAKLCAPDGAIYQKMALVEKLVSGITTPFYCGEEPSLADYHLYAYIGFIRSGFMDGVTSEFIDSFATVKALRSKVAELPKVKEAYGGSPPKGLEC